MKVTKKNLNIILENSKVGEFVGWDFFFGKRDSCCPGDDIARIYNLALADIKKTFTIYDTIEDYLEHNEEEDDTTN